MLEAYGEILPLETTDGIALYALNVTCVLDALDEDGSEIIRFPGSHRIMDIRSAVFRDSVVQGVDIFKLPLRASQTYVSDRFVAMVTRKALKGLEFCETWPRNAIRH